MLKKGVLASLMVFAVIAGGLGCNKKQETKQEGQTEMQAPQADTAQQAEPQPVQ